MLNYFINTADSLNRRPCSKCGELPTIARRSDGSWVSFCAGCDLDRGFEGLNPNWYYRTKDDAIYNWSGRQLVYDLFHKYANLTEVADDDAHPLSQ